MDVKMEWHNTVTPELRQHLVNKLIEAVNVTKLPSHMRQKLLQYLPGIEVKAFNQSDSRAQYYCSIAQKIYTIQVTVEKFLQNGGYKPEEDLHEAFNRILHLDDSQKSEG